jgi:hypothetical protein
LDSVALVLGCKREEAVVEILLATSQSSIDELGEEVGHGSNGFGGAHPSNAKL